MFICRREQGKNAKGVGVVDSWASNKELANQLGFILSDIVLANVTMKPVGKVQEAIVHGNPVDHVPHSKYWRCKKHTWTTFELGKKIYIYIHICIICMNYYIWHRLPGEKRYWAQPGVTKSVMSPGMCGNAQPVTSMGSTLMTVLDSHFPSLVLVKRTISELSAQPV